jgi:glucose-6-phosphate dehydrogenase assembly protein OpcA
MVVTHELQELARWRQEPTDAGAICAALLQLWREAGRQRREPGGLEGGSTGALRTRVANVLAYASSAEDEQLAERVLASLALRHPCRSVLMVARPDSDGNSVGASLRIYQRTAGGRSVCFEQIQLTAEGDGTRQLAGIATQLLVHDLPTLIWWTGSPDPETAEFVSLADLSDVMVIDSARLENHVAGLASLARAANHWRGRTVLSDLNWNRLADWRELAAQFFDSRATRPLLGEIRRVEVEVAAAVDGGVESAQSLLLAGWLGSRLGWETRDVARSPEGLRFQMARDKEPVEVRVVASAVRSAARGDIKGLRIEAGPEGGCARFSLQASEIANTGTATIEHPGGQTSSRCFPLDDRDGAVLLAEEVEALGHERALDEALDFAGRIAGRLAG